MLQSCRNFNYFRCESTPRPLAGWSSLAILVLAACMLLGSASRSQAETPAAAGTSLFDGKTLGHWKPTAFGGEGDVEVKDGLLLLGAGNPMTGVTWTGDIPKMDYEISLDAKRVDGSDFFCALTFPVGKDPCSFIAGGWGGGVVGLSNIDGSDASENETTKYLEFERDRWYKIRVRVTTEKIQAWIDKHEMVDLETKDRRISIRTEVELSRPLGIACYSTKAALREIKVIRLDSARK